MNNITYLDTSGLNYLADNIKDFDLFRFWRETLKIDFCISAVVIWEVLLNSNEKRRDYLIYWAQFNCSQYLLKSPTELFISYLKSNCPKNDKKDFWYNRETDLDIGNTWKKIHGDIEKTIPIDIESLKERTKPVRDMSKSLKSILDEMTNKDNDNYHDDTFHKAMLRAIKNLNRRNPINKEDETIIKLSLVYVLFFLCIGLELDNTPIRMYWQDKEIEDPFERLDWLIENLPEVVIRGPVIEMAKMAEAQFITSNSKSRGLLHDCLHSVYCYYADNVITGDEHFKTLRDKEKHEVFKGIIMVDDFNKMWRLTTEEIKKKYSQPNV